MNEATNSTDGASRGDAADLIAYTENVRRRTRVALGGFWFPLILFGALTLISAPVVWRYGGASLAVFWVVSGPVGGIITGVYFWRREGRTGVTTSPLAQLAHLVVVAVLFVGAFGLPAVTDGTLREVISGIWVGLCYIAFGRIERSWVVALAGGATVAAILMLVALNPAHLTFWAAIVMGTLFLGTGVWLKLREESP